MQTEVNPLSVPWRRKRITLIINGVFENVLVCAQFYSKLAQVYMLYYANILIVLDLGYFRFLPFMPKLCGLFK